MNNDNHEVEHGDPHFIAVEGPIGVGKTSLARRLAKTFASELILERPDENPFLEGFYQDRGHAALPAQLFFLFQRSRQIEQLRQRDLFSPVRIADFLIDKDRIFAELNLDANELQLYDQIARTLDAPAPTPDLVIYLQAPARVLMRRIAQRGVAYERAINQDYLVQLGEAYTRFFYFYEAAPLLIVNAESIDPVNREADYQQLLAAIRRVKHGRHFFNPVAAALA